MSVTLDEEHLAEIQEMLGDTELKGVIETFHSYSEELMESISKHCVAGSKDKTVLLIHSLKGCCKNIGVISLAKECAELESIARSGKLDSVQLELPALRRRFADARQALDDFLIV